MPGLKEKNIYKIRVQMIFFDFLNVHPFSPGGFFTFLVALAHGTPRPPRQAGLLAISVPRPFATFCCNFVREDVRRGLWLEAPSLVRLCSHGSVAPSRDLWRKFLEDHHSAAIVL